MLAFIMQFNLSDCKSNKVQIFNVKDYGAKGDGTTLDTIAIQKTISACFAAGGGQVYFPDGEYLTGSINLTSNMILYISEGATIYGSENPKDFALIEGLPSYPFDRGNSNPRYAPIIYAVSQSDIQITGGGTINGQGFIWWYNYKEHIWNITRPPLLHFRYCNNILINDISLEFSPYYTIHPFMCNNVTVDNISIFNPVGSPNTDGIDPDSSTNIVITNNVLATSDDHISLKSGKGTQGMKFAKPTANVFISNNTLTAGSGIAIGSETAGSIFNVTIVHNQVSASVNGVRVKSCASWGGVIQNITYSDLSVKGVDIAIYVNLFYECDGPQNSIPTVELNLNNISGETITAGEFKCAPQKDCVINMDNVDLYSIYGFSCSNVEGTTHQVYPKPCY